MENPKKISPEKKLETEVADFVQIGLMQKFLKRELGEDYKNSKKKIETEIRWVKEHALDFRRIFSVKENKKLFIEAYQSNKDGLIDYVEQFMNGDV